MRVIVSADHRGSWPTGIERVYPHVFLIRDNWNDYGYETLFKASLRESEDQDALLGSVKVAYFGHSFERNMRDVLKPEQPGLGPDFFSLGQGLEYYQTLAQLPAEVRGAYAKAMRDIPLLQIPREKLEREPAFETSLMRTSGAREALDKAPTLFGQEVLDVSVFDFTTTLLGAAAPHRIKFDFSEDSGLPHRVNVLVGVNGVGKTQLMARLAMLLTSFERKEKQNQRIAEGQTLRDVGTLFPLPSFYSVIAVSFSAFDDFELPDVKESDDYRYAYCGLRRREGGIDSENALPARIPAMLRVMDDDRRLLAVEALEKALGRKCGLDQLSDEGFHRTLSAGQRIVANIVSDLCLHLRSRSLVLLDEPETHLHPQLVTRLLSVLNDLLEGFDSAAVIATHSPIVVQQTLARRVHVIRRLDGDVPVVDAAPVETFGENLSDIVRLVFDAPEIERGYQEVLDGLLKENKGDVAAVERMFDGQLGFNAQIYLRSKGRQN